MEENEKWILGCASKSAHRFVTKSDDEWSVALMAFSEAVRSYDDGKGEFLPFASVVIKRRILDYLRSEGRRSGEVSVAPEVFEGEIPEDNAESVHLMVQQKIVEDSFESDAERNAPTAKEEIEKVQKLLEKYGFSLFDLAECSPKAEKTKKCCADAVNALLSGEDLLDKMKKSASLPIKELCDKSGVKRKILERHRKYIIAAAEILGGDFPVLAEYMNYIRRERQ